MVLFGSVVGDRIGIYGEEVRAFEVLRFGILLSGRIKSGEKIDCWR